MAKRPERQTASGRYDAKLAKQARSKIKKGQAPAKDELAALRRIERDEHERFRWECYRSIPKKHWREMSGRQAVQLNRDADKYGLPIRGRTVDLADVVSWLHSFLAENASAFDTDDALLSGPKTPSLERLRKAQAEKVEMQNRLTRGELRAADDVHRCYGLIASEIRQASSELLAEFGKDANQILADAIQRADDRLAQFEKEIPTSDGDGD